MKRTVRITSLIVISLIFLVLSLAPILSSVAVLESNRAHQQEYSLEITQNGDLARSEDTVTR